MRRRSRTHSIHYGCEESIGVRLSYCYLTTGDGIKARLGCQCRAIVNVDVPGATRYRGDATDGRCSSRAAAGIRHQFRERIEHFSLHRAATHMNVIGMFTFGCQSTYGHLHSQGGTIQRQLGCSHGRLTRTRRRRVVQCHLN